MTGMGRLFGGGMISLNGFVSVGKGMSRQRSSFFEGFQLISAGVGEGVLVQWSLGWEFQERFMSRCDFGRAVCKGWSFANYRPGRWGNGNRVGFVSYFADLE